MENFFRDPCEICFHAWVTQSKTWDKEMSQTEKEQQKRFCSFVLALIVLIIFWTNFPPKSGPPPISM